MIINSEINDGDEVDVTLSKDKKTLVFKVIKKEKTKS